MNVQFIEKEGHREWAVLPYTTYQHLLDAYEMLRDIQAFDQAIAREEEMIPVQWIDRLLNGESPVQVWREYRQMTQDELAQLCGVTREVIKAVEMKTRQPDPQLCANLARCLRVEADELMNFPS